mgnify:CR=1 FL=1
MKSPLNGSTLTPWPGDAPQHLRPLFRTVDLSATRVNAPILEAIHFLKAAFDNACEKIHDFPGRRIGPGIAAYHSRTYTCISNASQGRNSLSVTQLSPG